MSKDGTTRRLILAATLLGMTFFAAAGAQAALVNGSFESGTDPGSFLTLNSGASDLTGWTIASGSIDYIGSYWAAADGSRSIDLNGNAPGAIYQSFATQIGQQYKVTFSMAGNPDGAPGTKSLNSFVKQGNGNVLGSTSVTFDTAGKSKSNMGWTEYSYLFTAGGTRATLWFESTTTSNIPDGFSGNPFGPALDGIKVEAVPIPATLILFGSGLVGLVGIGRRRLKK